MNGYFVFYNLLIFVVIIRNLSVKLILSDSSFVNCFCYFEFELFRLVVKSL